MYIYPLLASESADARRGRPAAPAHVRHVAPVPVLMPMCCVPRGMRRDGAGARQSSTRLRRCDAAPVRPHFVSTGTRRCRRVSCPSREYSRNRHLLLEHFWFSAGDDALTFELRESHEHPPFKVLPFTLQPLLAESAKNQNTPFSSFEDAFRLDIFMQGRCLLYGKPSFVIFRASVANGQLAAGQ